MKLVEINALHAEAPQRGIAFPAYRFWLEYPPWLCLWVTLIPDQSTLGENQWAL
jgi:hypothetical protein